MKKNLALALISAFMFGPINKALATLRDPLAIRPTPAGKRRSSRYAPHQGVREMARRARVGRIESKPRRMWLSPFMFWPDGFVGTKSTSKCLHKGSVLLP